MKKIKLDNGITVLLEKMSYLRSVSIGFWIKVGSSNETAKNSGISHFIEHVLFKGTDNKNARQIAEVLDNVGGMLNAFSSKEYTCYYAKVMNEHLDLAIDLLFDILYNSTFENKEIKREKKVILEEIKMYEDTPDELIHDLFTQTIWDNSSLGRPILGTEDNVNSFTRKDVIDYMKENYFPENIIISIAGNIKYNETIELLKNISSGKKFKKEKREKKLIIPPSITPKRFVKYKDIEQVHLCMGFKGCSQTDKQRFAMSVLNTILGGSMSSKLFQEVREKKGLCYTIYSYQTGYKDAGLFTIYAGTSAEYIDDLLQTTVKEINKIKKGKITNKEIHNAIEQLKGSFTLSLESTSNIMSRNARNEIYFNKSISIDDTISDISKVTKEDVIDLAKSIFKDDYMTLVAVGPIEEQKLLDIKVSFNDK